MTNREKQEIETILLNLEDENVDEVAKELAQRFGKKALDILVGFEKWEIISLANGENISKKAAEIINYFLDAYGEILIAEVEGNAKKDNKEWLKAKLKEALEVYKEWMRRSAVNFEDVIKVQLMLSSSKLELIELIEELKKMSLEYDLSKAEFAGGLEEVINLLFKALSETE